MIHDDSIEVLTSEEQYVICTFEYHQLIFNIFVEYFRVVLMTLPYEVVIQNRILESFLTVAFVCLRISMVRKRENGGILTVSMDDRSVFCGKNTKGSV